MPSHFDKLAAKSSQIHVRVFGEERGESQVKIQAPTATAVQTLAYAIVTSERTQRRDAPNGFGKDTYAVREASVSVDPRDEKYCGVKTLLPRSKCWVDDVEYTVEAVATATRSGRRSLMLARRAAREVTRGDYRNTRDPG